jgi:hypothetical protein
MSLGMATRESEREPGERTWQDELWQWIQSTEDLIDRMALRLGDAILGAERCERIFGPHRHRRGTVPTEPPAPARG